MPGLAPSRAGSLPQWICESIDFRGLTQKPVGASLLAKALGQALTLLDVPTLSRAGPLLQRGWIHAQRIHHQ
ncbi:hypothetical protein E1508_24905 [Pseudomonas moraviensis]|nr:hypothetical protein E1508_24905 [Pseudomonas moraviensis]